MRRLAGKRIRLVLLAAALVLVVLVLVFVIAVRRLPGTYHETFDSQGKWGIFGSVNPEGMGVIEDGVYYMEVPSAQQRVWSIADGQRFGDALYSVEVTQIGGPLRNGHGLIWRVADEDEGARFYFFVISGEGMISGGYCYNDCAGAERNLTDGGWLSTEAIHTGYDVTNTIAVRAEGPDFIFYINDEYVWSVHDPKFAEGDIGLIVEAYEEGGPSVYFDNFRVEPLE